MLTIEECRKYLKDFNLTDNEVEEIRNSLHSISEKLLNKHFEDESPNLL